MTRFYVRRESVVRETVAAMALAVGVGGLSFYLARVFLARERVESKAPPLVAGKPARHSLAESGGRKGVE